MIKSIRLDEKTKEKAEKICEVYRWSFNKLIKICIEEFYRKNKKIIEKEKGYEII